MAGRDRIMAKLLEVPPLRQRVSDVQKSCETQMMVLAADQSYSLPSEDSCEKSAGVFWGNGRMHDRDWPALMKLADQIDPSFRN
jgi:hypothetical protein